jgi:hypothetical protein
MLKKLSCKASKKNKFFFENAIKNKLTMNNIDFLCKLINDEFIKNGIDENFEPNEYGHELENLLDEINRPRLQ